jgi:taurine dioxygenase
MTITVTPRSAALGAEISGIDLREPISAEDADAIHRAWLDHLVLVFRGQELSDDDQIRFAETFGPVGDYMRPSTLRTAPMEARHHAVMFVSNIRENGEAIGALPDGEMMFHTDTGYDSNPHKGTTLFAVEIPSKGGNTIFCNQYKVHDELPERLRSLLQGREAYNAYEFGTTIKTKEKYDSEEMRSAVHPIFLPHKETGRPAIFVNELMTEEIVGLPADESRAVLDELFALQREPRFLYEHEWRLGDLVMWDNRCTLHARTDFPREERRLLRRVTIAEGDPVRRAVA